MRHASPRRPTGGAFRRRADRRPGGRGRPAPHGARASPGRGRNGGHRCRTSPARRPAVGPYRRRPGPAPGPRAGLVPGRHRGLPAPAGGTGPGRARRAGARPGRRPALSPPGSPAPSPLPPPGAHGASSAGGPVQGADPGDSLRRSGGSPGPPAGQDAAGRRGRSRMAPEGQRLPDRGTPGRVGGFTGPAPGVVATGPGIAGPPSRAAAAPSRATGDRPAPGSMHPALQTLCTAPAMEFVPVTSPAPLRRTPAGPSRPRGKTYTTRGPSADGVVEGCPLVGGVTQLLFRTTALMAPVIVSDDDEADARRSAAGGLQVRREGPGRVAACAAASAWRG